MYSFSRAPNHNKITPTTTTQNRTNRTRVRNLDVRFASAVMGDGNNNVIGPFKNGLSQFFAKELFLCAVSWCFWRGK